MIKNNLEEILKSKNISIRKLSMDSGIDYSLLFKLAKNKTRSIKFDNLFKIKKAINCSLDELFVEIEDEEKGDGQQ